MTAVWAFEPTPQEEAAFDQRETLLADEYHLFDQPVENAWEAQVRGVLSALAPDGRPRHRRG